MSLPAFLHRLWVASHLRPHHRASDPGVTRYSRQPDGTYREEHVQ